MQGEGQRCHGKHEHGALRERQRRCHQTLSPWKHSAQVPDQAV